MLVQAEFGRFRVRPALSTPDFGPSISDAVLPDPMFPRLPLGNIWGCFVEIIGRQMSTHYEIRLCSSCSAAVVNRYADRGRRLAAVARAATKRSFAGNGAAGGVAEGRTEVALEEHRCRHRLLHARRGGGSSLPARQ